ncbi:MAG: DNA (cytosine-5-)-methyltransferase [Mediterranea sp.]|nr:DNA (cytosine-5-)-methyltransferase [Mediterranea sp.]
MDASTCPKPARSAKEGKPLNVLSLFSGCGGMDLGFEGGFVVHAGSVNESLSPDFVEKSAGKDRVLLRQTAFRIVFANDILKEARVAWTHHFAKLGYPPAIYRTDSVVDLVKRQKTGENVFPPDIDVVTGGFPCQDFSLSGNRRGFQSRKDHQGKPIQGELPSEETRGKLYYWMKEVIDITRPKIFIAENVKGLVNLGDVKDIIQRDFSSADGGGYIVLSPQVLHAANYGVPQSRERVIFIGIRKDLLKREALEALTQENIPEAYNPYPHPTHAFSVHGERLAPPQTLRNVFAHLREPDESGDPSQQFYSKAKFMGKHCQGQIEVCLDSIGPTIRSEHHGNIEYRRLSAEHGGKENKELRKGLPERRLTPRECGLIQTFPTDYEFVFKEGDGKRYALSASGAYKVIGNAVPPLLAYHIARRIESLWNLYFE